MKRAIVVFVFGSFVLSCSSESSKSEPPDKTNGEMLAPGSPRSGSRLRIVRYKATENVYAESSLRDAELGPCTPLYATDGTIRCAPVGGFAGLVFSDPGCTEPFVLGDAGCPPSFVVSANGVGPLCEKPPVKAAHVYAVKAPFTAPAEHYELLSTGCTKATRGEGATTFAVEEVPPSKMVALEKKDESVGQVAVRMLISEDGLRYPIGLADVATGKSCSLNTRTSDGQAPTIDESTVVACIPGKPAFDRGDRFTDSSCKTPAASLEEDGCTTAPSFVETTTGVPGVCTKTTKTTRAAGAQLSGAFVSSNNACSPYKELPGVTTTYWAIGETLNLSSFASVNRAVVGEGKLRSVTYTADGKTLFEGEGGFLQGTSRCRAVDVGGTTYCVPFDLLPAPRVGGPFADSECKRPVTIRSAPCGPLPLIAELVPPTACTTSPSLGRIYDLGPRAMKVYELQGGCQEMPLHPDWEFYELGPERRASEVFAKLDRIEL
jgi:hypothetical protein